MTELTIYKTEELFNSWGGTFCSGGGGGGGISSGKVFVGDASSRLSDDRLMYDIEVTEYYNYEVAAAAAAGNPIGNKKMANDLSAIKETSLVRSAYQWNDDKI